MTQRASVGAYIHVPFCRNKCDYCDFYSVVSTDKIQQDYVVKVVDEIQRQTDHETPIDSIYFGGGTPSLLRPLHIQQIIEALTTFHRIEKEAEITLECNPELVNDVTLKAFKSVGITRISLGIQTFQPSLLRVLGRQRQSGIEPIVDAALNHFDHVSLDFMVGIPTQTVEMVENDWAKIPDNVEHVSLYDLTLYAGTPLAKRVEKHEVYLNPETHDRALELAWLEHLSQKGFFQYEVSNFAKPNAKSKHNLHYWHYDDYRGFGAGAVSSWKGQRVANECLHAYMTGKYVQNREPLDIPTQKLEWLMMNLRLVEGFSRSRYIRRFGVDVVEEFAETFYEQSDYFDITPEQVALTPTGLMFHHTVLSAFVR